MKKINYLSFLALASGLLACESFPVVDAPDTQIATAQVFLEPSNAEAALADIYARIRNEGVASGTTAGATVLLSNYADDLQFFGPNKVLESFSQSAVLPSNTYLENIWRGTYGQIYAVNAFYEGVTNSAAIAPEAKNRYIGEVLFLRAYLHFNLLNMFGEVPYVTVTHYEVNKRISKSTVPQLYASLLDDLTEAAQKVPDDYPTAQRVRVNKATVHALMARIYLYTKDWQQAKKHASLVLENPLYSWQENIESEFLKDNPSIIWALHPGIAGLNTKEAQNFIVQATPPTVPVISTALFNAFTPEDLRKTTWMKRIPGAGGPWYHAYKYKETTNTGDSKEYSILFRLAELYLIRAECEAQLGNIQGAQNDLNKTRHRAGLTGTDASTPQALIAAIVHERRLEFFTEQGHRFFDLKRTGTADPVLAPSKPNWNPSHAILPLPENELLLNTNLLPQNPGYE